MIADYSDTSIKKEVFQQGDKNIEPSAFIPALNSYGENVRTRIIMVTPCDMIPPELVDALGMALDVDPAFFQFAINYIRRKSYLGAPPFQKFGQFVILEPFLYTQILQVQKGTAKNVHIGKLELKGNSVITCN